LRFHERFESSSKERTLGVMVFFQYKFSEYSFHKTHQYGPILLKSGGKRFSNYSSSSTIYFFQFMDPPQIKIWLSLCNLGYLIFQTHIDDMDTCILDLKNHIDLFSNLIVLQDSAQWRKKA
jgi:hypothetical protein